MPSSRTGLSCVLRDWRFTSAGSPRTRDGRLRTPCIICLGPPSFPKTSYGYLPKQIVIGCPACHHRRAKIPYNFQPLSAFPAMLENCFPDVSKTSVCRTAGKRGEWHFERLDLGPCTEYLVSAKRRYGFLLTGVNREYLVQPCASEQICYVLSGTDQSDLTFLAARSREEAHERS